MTSPSFDPRDRSEGTSRPDVDDLTIVPGLGPSGPLDMSQDPDRYDPVRDATAPVAPVDMAQDPDRFRPPGQGQTLTDLLGEGAHEDERDNFQWAIGLLSVLAFIALVAWLFGSVLSP